MYRYQNQVPIADPSAAQPDAAGAVQQLPVLQLLAPGGKSQPQQLLLASPPLAKQMEVLRSGQASVEICVPVASGSSGSCCSRHGPGLLDDGGSGNEADVVCSEASLLCLSTLGLRTCAALPPPPSFPSPSASSCGSFNSSSSSSSWALPFNVRPRSPAASAMEIGTAGGASSNGYMVAVGAPLYDYLDLHR